MPTYAYACSACEHAFDVRQSFSDEALTTCPECEQESLRKVFSPVGVVFKGSGFYRNDSRAANKGKKAGSGKAASAKEGSDGSAASASPKPDSSGSGSSGSGSSGSGSSGGGSVPASTGSGSSGSKTSGSGSATPAA